MSERLQSELNVTESRDERLARTLCHAARTHLDLFMDAKEWRELGFAAIYPMDLPDQFHWTVYVQASKRDGTKRLGVHLFNATGYFDTYEIASPDPDLPLSDAVQQGFIKEEMGKLADAERARKEQLHHQEVQRAEKERGFPAGVYTVRADFPIRSGGRYREMLAHDFRVGETETRESVFSRAESDAYMQGLHNYQLDVRLPRRYAIVTLIMQRPGIPDITWEVKINISGHPPSETDMKEHRES